jgi:hypothetical protein
MAHNARKPEFAEKMRACSTTVLLSILEGETAAARSPVKFKKWRGG